MGKKRQSNNNKSSIITKESKTDSRGRTAALEGFPERLLPYLKKKRKFQVSSLVPSAVFVARNFMDPNECQAWIEYSESLGYERLCSPQTREFAHRECGRISKTDWDMADRLYQRMKPIVDEITKQVVIPHFDESYAPLTCNGNLRLYRYNKNMSFGRHYDGSERISKFKGAATEMTVLVYLSSVEGGATRFYLPTSSKNKTNKKSKTEESNGIAFVPECGAILVHIHGDRCLAHEADPVIDGVKYILRTDIVFGPQPK